ncbi:hypothetical protein ACPA2N_22500 [Ectopseudomonas hydrolytica]|uniref:hypothetical protein n=1 Tax=Ectopseudomonas hydrolytica TaxID=2493633 RepID=UPI003C2FBDB5
MNVIHTTKSAIYRSWDSCDKTTLVVVIAEDGVYVTFSAKDQIDGEGRKCGAGKWLKSYRFAEPVFDELPAEVSAKLNVATVDTANPA